MIQSIYHPLNTPIVVSVPEHHRLLDADGAEAAVVEVVQVGAADAAEGDVHAQLVVTQWRQFCGFDAKVFGGVADNGFHGRVQGRKVGKFKAWRSHRHRRRGYGR